MNYKFVILNIKKSVTGEDEEVSVYKFFSSDKTLNQHFYFEMDTTPTALEEVHKAYYQKSTDSYFAPIPNQEYRITTQGELK